MSCGEAISDRIGKKEKGKNTKQQQQQQKGVIHPYWGCVLCTGDVLWIAWQYLWIFPLIREHDLNLSPSLATPPIVSTQLDCVLKQKRPISKGSQVLPR